MPGAWGPAPVKPKYQWKANGANIYGASSSTYVIQPSVRGKRITVWVAGDKTGYAHASRVSLPTGAVS